MSGVVKGVKDHFRYFSGATGATGFGSASTAEDVSMGVDLTEKVAIVTGANTGIGQETARVLALRGAHVILGVRNEQSGEKAKEGIMARHPHAKVQVMKLDLSSKAAVRQFADKFHATRLPLHILVNNAGVMACPFSKTVDGREMQFGTNHLGHFLLVNLLLGDLTKSAESSGQPGRIVNVSSLAHEFPYKGGIRFDKLDSSKGYYAWLAYGQSKLANILHAKELARMLKADRVPVVVNSLHPGSIRTDLQRHLSNVLIVLIGVLYNLTWYGWKTIPQGAATSVYLACNPQAENISGQYFQDVNEVPGSALARDMDLAKRLWDVSERLLET